MGYTLLVLAIAVVAVVLATRAPVPARLPGVALGSGEVLIAERAVSLFAILFLAVLVVVRAAQGRLPEELSGRGVKYAASDAVDELRDRIDRQFEAYDGSLEQLELGQQELDERMASLEAGESAGREG